jgi:hypothetical protein
LHGESSSLSLSIHPRSAQKLQTAIFGSFSANSFMHYAISRACILPNDEEASQPEKLFKIV